MPLASPRHGDKLGMASPRHGDKPGVALAFPRHGNKPGMALASPRMAINRGWRWHPLIQSNRTTIFHPTEFQNFSKAPYILL
jgi:hypothetical protein